jgi:predicted nucleic acid-binding Zn ribbon protein
MTLSSFSEPRLVYERLRKKFGGYAPRKTADVQEGESVAFGSGRDPGSMSEAFADLSLTMGWISDLARAELMEHWADIVGPEVALHATPMAADKGVLEVHCDSSAWATQLRMMRGQLVNSLREKFPDADITEVAVKAPGAPSWKHGRRSVPGRGPRDTYG